MNNPFRPYKSDLYQIDHLVKLGCSESDICLILNITSDILSKWKAKNKGIEDLLKPKARPEYTINHPEYAPTVEEAFPCAGKRFYRFKEEYRMSTGRYKYYYEELRQVLNKVDLKTLNEYVAAFETVLNGGKKKKEINHGDLWELIINLKSRLKLAFDPQTVKNLAAIAYFDDTEDITSYDKKYGEKKIDLWVSHNVYDFFLTRPMGELLDVSSISLESFLGHLKELDGIVAETNSNLRTVLEANS